METERQAFLEERRALIDQLRRQDHHPELKFRLLAEQGCRLWEDRQLIWALEESGEEDILIELIAAAFGWSEDRVAEAMRQAGWMEERIIRLLFKLDMYAY